MPVVPMEIAVADANGVEPVGDEAGLSDGVADSLGKIEEMHVAGVALEPNRRDADLGLVHVGLGETGTVEHGLGGTLGLGLRDCARDFVVCIAVAATRSRRGEEAAAEGFGGQQAGRAMGIFPTGLTYPLFVRVAEALARLARPAMGRWRRQLDSIVCVVRMCDV